MGLILASTFAASLWIVLTALGAKSFDGFLLGLVIVLVVAGSRALAGALPGVRRED